MNLFKMNKNNKYYKKIYINFIIIYFNKIVINKKIKFYIK